VCVFCYAPASDWRKATRIISIAFARAAESSFPQAPASGAQGPDHLTFRSRGRLEECRCRSTASDPGRACGSTSSVCIRHARHGLIGDVLRAYERLVLGCHARRPHAVSPPLKASEARLWEVSTPLLESPPPVRLLRAGSWGPNAIHQLIAPRAWRLPFERAWPRPEQGRRVIPADAEADSKRPPFQRIYYNYLITRIVCVVLPDVQPDMKRPIAAF